MSLRAAAASVKGLVDDARSVIARVNEHHPLHGHPVLGRGRYLRRLSHDGRHRPVMLICETVNICNNDCIICPYSVHSRSKGTMTMDLFEHLLSEYATIGGGFLSLTPMVGEVFLDRWLGERIALATACPAIRGLSITTNATHADRHSPRELAELVRPLRKVHISIYGMTADEHRELTKRDDHDRVLASVRAIIEACNEPGKVALAFRLLRWRDKDEVVAWARDLFGDAAAVTHVTTKYSNWGGVFDADQLLPQDAEWESPRTNRGQCLVPMVSYQVFVNGDVSFCSCCDFDANPEFSLGNIREKSLRDICDSPRVRELWDARTDDGLPAYCRQCTFHVPVESVKDHPFIFDEPLRFIGG